MGYLVCCYPSVQQLFCISLLLSQATKIVLRVFCQKRHSTNACPVPYGNVFGKNFLYIQQSSAPVQFWLVMKRSCYSLSLFLCFVPYEVPFYHLKIYCMAEEHKFCKCKTQSMQCFGIKILQHKSFLFFQHYRNEKGP